MTTKKLLTATFANGSKITRTTDRDYGFAWMAFGADKDGKLHASTGFASSDGKARAAATTVKNYFTHNPSGIEIVKTVATAPAKKVNPAKEKPFRIIETSAGGKRFVGGRTHLRFANRHEAVTKAAELKIANTERCAMSKYAVPCDYTATDVKKL